MNETSVFLLGFGGNGKVIADICADIGITIVGFFDDNISEIDDKSYQWIKFLGTCNDLINNNYQCKNAIITIGNIDMREKISRSLSNKGYQFPNIIHKNTYIARSAVLGFGNVIYNNATINSSAKVGNFNLINSSSIIEHDCEIGDFNNISPNVTICGTCYIRNNNFIGASTTIRNNITIGNNNIVGCASNIVKNIDSNEKGFGNPFNIIPNKNRHFLKPDIIL